MQPNNMADDGELRDEVTKIVTLARVFGKNKITPEPTDVIISLIEAEATRARIDELEKLKAQTETYYTESDGTFNYVDDYDIDEAITELKRQALERKKI